MNIKAPRGTQDVLPYDIHKWQYLEKLFLDISKKYGFLEIRIPTFEYTELFLRGVGDTTDVVSKEMYTFLDKGDRSITLKPEGTAGVVRSVLESGIINDGLPLKLCYNIPCFRYDKPQAGRLREFHQFGIECFGSHSYYSDVQVISLSYEMLKSTGINNVTLYINSIGCKACRPNYNNALLKFLKDNKNDLCKTCNERVTKNPMRVLDCKNDECKKIVENAPVCTDYLCDECSIHYNGLKNGLSLLKIPYIENSKIVRGLDYYTKTVFEFVSSSLGAQSTVCGGGRYDGLVEVMGGKNQPAVGFAMGVERLILIMENEGATFKEKDIPDIYIANVGEYSKPFCFKLANELRKSGLYIESDLLDKSLKSQMKYANKINAKYSIVIGEDEIKTNIVNLKNMLTGEDIKVNIDEIKNYIK